MNKGFLFFFIIITGCAPDIEKIKQLADNNEMIFEKGREVEILYSDQGLLKAKINAPELARSMGDKPSTFFNMGLCAYFYNKAMEIESTLSANYGVIDEEKDEMMVRDDVVLVNMEGEMLNTEELIWVKKEERIYSDKFVKITTPDEIIYGTGFESNQDFSDYLIKNISGIISIESDGLD